MKLDNLKLALAFIPNLLIPTGLFMSGDLSVIGIKPPQGSIVSYSIPSDKKGASLILNDGTSNPFYLYINKNKSDFENKINPPANEQNIERLGLVAITDKKLLGIMHHLLTTTMGNRRYKLKDTLHILNLLDNAIMLRTGQECNYTFPAEKWKTIKEEIEELVMTRQLEIQKSNGSVTPIKTDLDYTSDTD